MSETERPDPTREVPTGLAHIDMIAQFNQRYRTFLAGSPWAIFGRFEKCLTSGPVELFSCWTHGGHLHFMDAIESHFVTAATLGFSLHSCRFSKAFEGLQP